MSGLDATEARVGITGTMLIAPVGTDKPTDTTSAWPAGWVDLGYGQDDGPPASIRPNQTTKSFKGWQAFFPIRTVATDRSMQWMFRLVQRNRDTLALALGGGEFTDLGGGDTMYTPPEQAFIDEHAFGLEVVDGDIIDRYLLDRGMVTNVDEIVFRKDELIRFACTIDALAPTTGNDPWQLISNDPALATEGS